MRRNETSSQTLKLLASGAVVALLAFVTAGIVSGCGGQAPEQTGEAAAAAEAEQVPANAGRRLQPEVPHSPTRRPSHETVPDRGGIRTAGGGERTFTTVLTSRRTVTVLSRIAGTVTALEVEEGDRVRGGGVLARLDDRSRQIARDRAAAEARRTRALYERNREAFASNTAVRVVSALELEVSEAEYLKAQADSALAELELSYTRITAPFAGVVTERFIDAGEWIAAREDLFTVAELGRLWAVFIVPPEVDADLQSGQIVALRIGNGEITLDADGRLVRTSPVLDPASGGVKITIEITNSQSLYKPGMTATIDFGAPGG